MTGENAGGEEGAKDCPGVVAPPPLIYLGFLVLGLGLDHVWPLPLGLAAWRTPVAAGLIIPAAVLMAMAIRQFSKAGTNVPPTMPTKVIVSGGLYRFSRNPIYMALSLFYTGLGMAADSLWVLGLLAPVLVIMRGGVIAREEAYLERKFGEEYRRYKASVRRWL